MAIYFFREDGPNGYLSNFYETIFEKDGRTFKNSEQAFMFEKCKTFDPNNKQMLQAILSEENPKKVKQLGRRVKNYDELVWQNVRYRIMVDILRCKFEYNSKIRKSLLETGTRQLYEASPYDDIWGIGIGKKEAQVTNPEKFGKNLLGKALMEVRTSYQTG